MIPSDIPKYPWALKYIGLSDADINELYYLGVRPIHWKQYFFETAGEELFTKYVKATQDEDLINMHAEYCVNNKLADISRYSLTNLIAYFDYNTIDRYHKRGTHNFVWPSNNIDGMRWFFDNYSSQYKLIEQFKGVNNECIRYIIDRLHIFDKFTRFNILVGFIEAGLYKEAEEVKNHYSIECSKPYGFTFTPNNSNGINEIYKYISSTTPLHKSVQDSSYNVINIDRHEWNQVISSDIYCNAQYVCGKSKITRKSYDSFDIIIDVSDLDLVYSLRGIPYVSFGIANGDRLVWLLMENEA